VALAQWFWSQVPSSSHHWQQPEVQNNLKSGIIVIIVTLRPRRQDKLYKKPNPSSIVYRYSVQELKKGTRIKFPKLETADFHKLTVTFLLPPTTGYASVATLESLLHVITSHGEEATKSTLSLAKMMHLILNGRRMI
jgi:hypothetical protein